MRIRDIFTEGALERILEAYESSPNTYLCNTRANHEFSDAWLVYRDDIREFGREFLKTSNFGLDLIVNDSRPRVLFDLVDYSLFDFISNKDVSNLAKEARVEFLKYLINNYDNKNA